MTSEARSRAALTLGLIGFVLVAWWMEARSHERTGFDWRAEQRAYFAEQGTRDAPRVVTRLVVTDASGATAEEKCETCHVGARGPGSAAPGGSKTRAPHPGTLLGAHPMNVGCTHCHGGVPGELSLAAHAQTDARESSCLRCHGARLEPKDPARRADAERATARASAGRVAYRDLGCEACHGEDAADTTRRGPARPAIPLSDLDVRRRPDHVLAFLLGVSAPERSRTMPRSTMSREDAVAVVSYLYSDAAHAPTVLREDAERRANVPGASAEDGARLWDALGCEACHAGTLADIGRRASEDYLASYLLEPSRAHPRTRMPSFRLDAREAASLAKHLAKRTLGEPLGLSPEEARLVGSREAAASRVACRDGGEMPRGECGKRLYARAGCAACHGAVGSSAPDAPDAGAPPDAGAAAPRPAPLLGSMRATARFHDKAPSAYAYELGDEVRAGLAAFIEARALPPAPAGLAVPSDADVALAVQGEALVRELRCAACHGEGERPSPLRALLGDKAGTHLPPPLAGEGERARPEWLFAFLRRPGALGVRPVFHPEWVFGRLPPLEALAVRMPTFAMTEAETTAVVRFLGRGAPYPFTDVRPRERTPEERLSALLLLNRGDDRTRCTSCHYTGDLPVDRMKQDAASVAPSLGTLAWRRRPAWVASMLAAHDASHGARDRTARLSEKDAALVTDVLFALDERARLPRVGEEARAPLP